MVDDDRAPSPEEMLRVMEEQNAATVKMLYADTVLLYVPWGVAWLFGFTALFLHYGLDGQPYAPITQMQAVGVLMAGQVVAGAFAVFGMVRMNRLVRGGSATKGAMYGYAWFAGMFLMTVIALRLSPQLPPEESGLLWAGSSLMVVAVLHMVAARSGATGRCSSSAPGSPASTRSACCSARAGTRCSRPCCWAAASSSSGCG